jgi:hypothetical protein
MLKEDMVVKRAKQEKLVPVKQAIYECILHTQKKKCHAQMHTCSSLKDNVLHMSRKHYYSANQ